MDDELVVDRVKGSGRDVACVGRALMVFVGDRTRYSWRVSGMLPMDYTRSDSWVRRTT